MRRVNWAFYLVAASGVAVAVAALIGGAHALGKWRQYHRAWLKRRPA